MLRELFIQNIAIIEDLIINFKPGLNIISGETGSGKSVIISALGLLLGTRASNDILRSDCEKGLVSGAFEVDSLFQNKLAAFGIPDIQDGVVVMSREISLEGKNLCRINEKIFSLSSFRAVGSLMIDIYGQSEERGLLVPGNQLDILDQFGGAKLNNLKKETTAHFKKFIALKQLWEQEKRRQEEVREKIDFLRFQLNELENADLEDSNEVQHLEEEIRVLSGAESLVLNSQKVYGMLFGGSQESASAYDNISKSIEIFEMMVSIDPSLKGKETIMNDILYSIQDLSDFFRMYAENVQNNPNKLEISQDRLDFLRRLQKKYQKSLDDLMIHRDEIVSTLESHCFSEQRLIELEDEKDRVFREYLEAASGLTRLRQETGLCLSEQVMAVLEELEMKNARFEVVFPAREGLSETGMEDAQFMFSANTGEPLKPLQKVASGGELSRLMLALKSVLAELETVPVIVFDEVDTGIGGEAARKVGMRILRLAAAHQVICVTHSAQVAVFGDTHYVIFKKISGKRTVSQVFHLSPEARKTEIARMLGGKELDTAIKHAEKMLARARKEKI